MKDFYYILGTDANCSINEIKDAYRKLSKKFHPDLNQGDKYFEDRFREIKEAYETLSDPAKRLQYDNALESFKPKSPPANDKKQSYYQHQTSNQHNQPRPSTDKKSWIKSSGIGMTVTLILIALVLVVYIVDSFSHPKSKIHKVSAVKALPLKIVKHHKKKHVFKNKITSDSANIYKDSTGRRRFVLPVTNSKKQLPAKTNKQPVPVDKNNTDDNGNFLYATYVRPNATGIINMRESDNYSSAIIETIPANSQIFVIEKGPVYYKVFFNNHVGYIPKWSLQIK